ncbi:MULTISPECIES: hypothetical protein [Paenibacillus]|uniref:hypothetical protein n=1 Tax=Paenibacillus TaxID=44249 RepID=UPI00105A820D|nr:hypothetical protein [Paenibacillus amylolyticus]MCL6659198.1 hypothetical protein [Paenibacillus amylolyticus]TDL68486.1 hypothetical protein E2R58_04590 [Paenibacillus amylolyticus]
MNNINKILGVILMLGSVFISTMERISIRVSVAIVEAGYASGGTNVPQFTQTNEHPTGLLVYFMFFVGFILLVAGFPGSYKKNRNHGHSKEV